MIPGARFVALGLGLAAGIVVTRRAHRAPISPGWAAPVGGTQLRRSDLPVGGALALLVALALRRAGRRRASSIMAALAVGAAAGAVGTGVMDPLPAF